MVSRDYRSGGAGVQPRGWSRAAGGPVDFFGRAVGAVPVQRCATVVKPCETAVKRCAPPCATACFAEFPGFPRLFVPMQHVERAFATVDGRAWSGRMATRRAQERAMRREGRSASDFTIGAESGRRRSRHGLAVSEAMIPDNGPIVNSCSRATEVPDSN
jgi:hypothetical protein